jgi:hypothetical protein
VKFGLESLEGGFGEVVYLGHAHRVTPGGKPCDGRAKTCELPQDSRRTRTSNVWLDPVARTIWDLWQQLQRTVLP